MELAQQCGLMLDPWQAYVLDGALGERSDGRWAAREVGLIVGRQNGKGAILEARALAGLVLFGEQLILWSAHETKTAFEAFRRMEALILGSQELTRRFRPRITHGNGNEGIELSNGCRLRFVARSKGSGRGFSGDLVILDEAYALTSDQIEALFSTSAARPNPQTWYTSSPPLDGGSGGQLYRLRKRAEDGDPALAWYDWGIQGVSLEDLATVDLDDRDLWYAANPALGIRISEEFVESERRALSAEGFARERLGIWPREIQAGSGVIPVDWWAQLVAPELPDTPERPSDVALALWVARDRSRAAIGYAGRRVDGLVQAGLVDWRPGTGWVVDRLVQLRQQWEPVAVVVDTRSESLLPELERRGLVVSATPSDPQRGDLVVPTAADTAAAFGAIVDAALERRLVHTDDAPVNEGIATARTRSLAGGLTWDGEHVGPLKAVTLAVWAHETRAHLTAAEDLDEVGVW